MPLTVSTVYSDCWADENKPNSNNPNTPRLRLRDTDSGEGKRSFLWYGVPFFPGSGVTVVSAKLKLYAARSWSGTHTITARRITQEWSETKLTWAKQPSVTNTNAASEQVSDLSPGDEIEIDVTAMHADVAAGAVPYGIRLEIDTDTADTRIWSSNAPEAQFRPRVEIEWRRFVEAPIIVAPSAGQAVGVASPTLLWRGWFEDSERAYSQVQISTSPSDFSSPVYDSGKVVNAESQWSLVGEYSLTPSTTYYWRVKVWDDAGQESEWSDVEQFTYTPKGTLTIISPPFSAEGYKELVQSMAPALYWPLDDEDGATDLSGNGRDGTGAGGITIGGDSSDPLGRGRKSTAFDGSDDRVTSSYDPFTNGTARTFTGWGYRDDASASMTLFGDVGFLSAQTSGDVMFSADDASEWDVFDAGLGTGAWFHWALVFDEAEDEAELFIDGVSVGVVEHSAPWASGVFAVGAKSPPNTDPLKGKLAHVAVFERALTPEQVAALADPASLSDGPSGVVEETTPPIVAQLDGATMTQYTVELYRRIDKAGVPWRIEFAKGWVDGSSVNETIPNGIIRSGEEYMVIVRARDDEDRASTPGDNSEYRAQRRFYYSRALSVGPDPVESLSITTDGPKAVVEWERTQTPDEFCIRVDGREVIQGIDPEDVRVDASTYRMDLWVLRPGIEHEIEVEAVVEMGDEFALYRRHSQNNPTQTVTLDTTGVWLVDPDDGTAVRFVGDSGGSLEMEIREVAETFDLVRSRRPVRITDVLGGYTGNYSGAIVQRSGETGADRDKFLDLKGRLKVLRFIAGDLNIPVRLEEVSAAPTAIPGHKMWEASFAFFQVGEFDGS